MKRVFGLWEEAGMSREDPLIHEQKMQTPHQRKTGFKPEPSRWEATVNDEYWIEFIFQMNCSFFETVIRFDLHLEWSVHLLRYPAPELCWTGIEDSH